MDRNSESTLLKLYNTKILPNLEYIEYLAYKGMSYKEISKEIDITINQFYLLRRDKRFSELNDALNGDLSIRNKNVEDSLYRLAVGFEYEEQTVQVIGSTYVNKDGKKNRREEPKVVKVKRYSSPNFQAIKFYLCNHDKEHYKSENLITDEGAMPELIAAAKSINAKVKKLADESNEDEKKCKI